MILNILENAHQNQAQRKFRSVRPKIGWRFWDTVGHAQISKNVSGRKSIQ